MSPLDKKRLRAYALSLGFDACRFTSADPPDRSNFFRQWLARGCHAGMRWLERQTDRRCDPRLALPDAQSVVLLAASYHAAGGATPSPGPPRGQIARYARYRDYHDVLSEPLAALTRFLLEVGEPGTRALAAVDSGPVMERDLAQRAGLGFMGKHTNLIHRQLGNWFFLAAVLTTARIAPDSPQSNRCGTCARCLEACPTGALPEPFVLDARRCISYHTIENRGPIPVELRPAFGGRIFGCDDCLAVCPWNRFAREGRLLRQAAGGPEAAPDLIRLLALDEAEFRRQFRETPIWRAKHAGFLRNVCVALGNVGDASALPHLERTARQAPPLVAEHAAWAIQRIEGRFR